MIPGWVSRRPVAAIALLAAVATLVSAWPVAFFGRSFVSPNFGTRLLYDHFPTLPGSRAAGAVDPRASDVGAMDWQDVPYSAMEYRAVGRDAELPLWNRYAAAGLPLLGQGQSMFGDPAQAIVIADRGGAGAWDLKFLAARWLFACGLGLAAWSLARHLPAGLLVAAAAPFAGFFLYRINHPAVFSLCYSPWPLVCALQAARATSRRAGAAALAGWFVADWALLNSGTVKEAYVLLGALNVAGLLVLATAELPWRERRRRLAGAGVMLVLLAAAAAPFWGAFLATLPDAYVTGGGGPARASQLPPGLLIALFDEAFYRPYVPGNGVLDPALNFLFLGGILYYLATLRAQAGNRTAFALAAFSLVPLSLAFGFVSPHWIAAVPFLGRVGHIDDDLGCVLIVLWAILAGVGFATAARRLGTADGRWDLGLAALGLFGLLFLYAAFGHAAPRTTFPDDRFGLLHGNQPVPIPPFLVVYFTVLAAGLVVFGWLARRVAIARRVGLGEGVALFACLGVFFWQGTQGLAAGGPNDYRVSPPPRVDFHAPSTAVAFVQAACAREPARVVGLGLNLFPGWAGFYGLENISGPDALMNPRFRQLADAMGLDRRMDWMLCISDADLSTRRRYLDFLNVGYYLDTASRTDLPPGLEPVASADLMVYRSPTVWPRAFFTASPIRVRGLDELLARIRNGDGRPFAALTSEAAAAEPGLAAPGSDRSDSDGPVPAFGYRLTEDSTAFSIRAARPGLAVLTEANWPGYPHAQLDGRPVRSLLVNQAFIGIYIPTAGEHRLVVRYRPRGFLLFEWIGAAGGLAALAALAMAWRQNTAI